MPYQDLSAQPGAYDNEDQVSSFKFILFLKFLKLHIHVAYMYNNMRCIFYCNNKTIYGRSACFTKK